MRQLRSVSLELSPSDSDGFGEVVTTTKVPGSYSMSPSPTRDTPQYSLGAKMQVFSLDVASTIEKKAIKPKLHWKGESLRSSIQLIIISFVGL